MPIAYQSLQACALRVTSLDDDGTPLVGASSVYTTKAFISVENSLVIAEGDSFEVKNACGDVCVSYEDCDRIKSTEGTVTLCHLDAEMIAMMTAATLLTDNAVQVITAPVGVTTFTLDYDGQVTSALTRASADGAAVQAALVALSNLEPGDVTVTGSAAGPWTATFNNAAIAGEVAILVPATASGTGTVTVAVTGNPSGLAVPTFDASCPNGFALEVWTKAWNGNQAALIGSSRAYFQHFWPRVLGTLGNFTLENNVLQVPVTLKGQANSALTALHGPAGDWPSGIGASPYGWFLTDTIPAGVAGPTAYPIPA